MKKYSFLKSFGFCLLLFVLGQTFVRAQGVNSVYFVINNQTGLPDDAVFLSLQNSGSFAAWGGGNSSLAANTSYSLADLLGNLPNGTGSQTQNVPIISSTTFAGGIFCFTLGQQVAAATPANNIVNGRFEVNIATGNSSSSNPFYNTNVDISYVNSISLPMSFSVLQRSNNSVFPLQDQLSTVHTSSNIWNAINSSTAISSAGGIVAAGNYAVVNEGGTTIGSMTGSASAVAPASTTNYHDWLTDSTTNTSLLNTLESGSGANLNTSSYTVATGSDVQAGSSWTYSGTPSNAGTSPFNSANVTTDSTNLFLAAQSYTMNSHFTTDLNPGGADANLTSQGIGAGTAGVIISGTGTSVGNCTIYITNTNLNTQNGIYGSNPFYVVKWQSFNGNTQNGTIAYVSQQNSNNLVDRVVGDLTAGITFGWGNATQTVAEVAAAAGKEAYLANTVFSSTYTGTGTSLATTRICDLSASQYFYLLSALAINGEADGTSGSNMAAFSGSGINTNPLLYDEYGNALVAYTDAYSYPYSDRLQGYSPDVFPMPGYLDQTAANSQYISITLSPGGYTYSGVPEPSTVALLLIAGAVGAGTIIRRRSAR